MDVYKVLRGYPEIGRPNNVSDPNSSIDSGTNINKCYNGYSGVNIGKDSDADNRIDIALGSNRNN